jgi:hypothetical protein
MTDILKQICEHRKAERIGNCWFCMACNAFVGIKP